MKKSTGVVAETQLMAGAMFTPSGLVSSHASIWGIIKSISTMFGIGTVLVLTLTLAVLASSPCYAQSAKSAAEPELTEIVVTAERRDSTVQKTPFSITAVTGEQLTERGLSSINDVAAEVPGISLRTSGPGQTEYEIRGLSSSGGSSATVGLYLNDVPLSAAAASLNGKVTVDPDLFDLSRVEVLRGPQGTLYGSGSEGGTIRLLTNPANLTKFETAEQLILSGTEHGGFNRGGSAMVNLPLVDNRLAVRLVGTSKYTEGFIDRIVVNPFPIGPGGTCGFATCTRGDVQAAPVSQIIPRSNWERLNGGRATVRFQPTDELSMDALIMHQKITSGGFSQADVPPGVNALAHYQPFNLAEPFEDTFRLYSFTINYDFSFAKLTSATSHISRDESFAADTSEVYQIAGTNFFGLPDLVPELVSETDITRQTTEELRLTSNGDGRLQWLVGGFFSNFESDFQQYTANPIFAPVSDFITGVPGSNPLGILYEANNPYHIKQRALFAEASYRITDTLKATAGLRWFKYDTELDSTQGGLFSQSFSASQYGGSTVSSASGSNPKFSLSYEPTGNLTVYAQAAKGFRPGGVNLLSLGNLCPNQPATYGPDTLWNYEVGEKAQLLNRRLTVNADVYYIRWTGVQLGLVEQCGIPFTANAGDAVSYGPEIEVNAQITPDLSVSFSGVYTRAYITTPNSSLAGIPTSPGTTLAHGLPLLNVPRYTVNIAVNEEIPLSGAYRLRARVAANQVGPTQDISYSLTELPAYTLVNARLSLFGGSLVPSLFVDNLTNKRAEVSINTQTFSIALPSLTRAAVNQPRTIGIDMEYKW